MVQGYGDSGVGIQHLMISQLLHTTKCSLTCFILFILMCIELKLYHKQKLQAD